MSADKPIERIIVGTGPASMAAAMAFRRRSIPFEVVDVGYDLESERQKAIERLGVLSPEVWPDAEREFLFPPPKASAAGVEKRFAFGSDFPYRTPGFARVTNEAAKVDESHAVGGFGNVWGAAFLPYSVSDTADWPVSRSDLEESYREVSAFVPVSGEVDGLAGRFPYYGNASGSIQRTSQSEFLLRVLQQRGQDLAAQGITFGRARLAVNSKSCQRCGQCLAGCVYGAIFNPRALWRQLEAENIKIHRGFYALEYKEHSDKITLRCRDLERGGDRVFTTRRLFLGLGAFASTRLVARSLGLYGKQIRLLDSQYFFFPWLSYRAHRTTPMDFTLAELFVEILNYQLSPRNIHLQVYGLNPIFRDTLRRMLPRPLRSLISLLRQIEDRFFLFQGFLPSETSGHLLLTLARSNVDDDVMNVVGVQNPAAVLTAQRVQSMIRNRLAGAGIVAAGSPVMVPIGRSFHLGGSFPMGSRDKCYSSDLLGRPGGSERVHLLDASTFPNIPASTITFTIMANADRVSRQALSLNN